MIALVKLSFRILISVIQFSTVDFHIYILTFSVRKERSINLVELDFLHFCQVKCRFLYIKYHGVNGALLV